MSSEVETSATGIAFRKADPATPVHRTSGRDDKMRVFLRRECKKKKNIGRRLQIFIFFKVFSLFDIFQGVIEYVRLKPLVVENEVSPAGASGQWQLMFKIVWSEACIPRVCRNWICRHLMQKTGLEEFPDRFRISYKLFSARAICR